MYFICIDPYNNTQSKAEVSIVWVIRSSLFVISEYQAQSMHGNTEPFKHCLKDFILDSWGTHQAGRGSRV